jgi:signal transduction histidine kinase
VKRSTRWWLVFAACNVVVAGALVWTSTVVVGLERSELRARAQIDYQESLRLAMWRMDSWLSLFLAHEAARPRIDYQPFGSRQEGDADVSSPLLTLESDYLLLHFEIDGEGNVDSPQVPPESVDSIPGVTEQTLVDRRKILERFRPHLTLEAARVAVSRGDSLVASKLASVGNAAPLQGEEDWNATQVLKSQNEFDARVACTVPRPPGIDTAGRQVVAWLDSPVSRESPALAFLRRVGSGEDGVFQGFILDWQRLRERLLFEIRDLFPVAELERVTGTSATIDPLGRDLANIPVTLVAPRPEAARAAWITFGRAALGVAWLAAITAAIAVGTTLRKSIDLGERRRRFVSAVTHELRTPLTTFRMYSEMLADGLVTDEAQRGEYLQTLKEEAQRLSSTVANVLTHARLEEQRARRSLEPMDLDTLISRFRQSLERRVEATGMTLEVETAASGSERLAVDAETIGQILGNLVDNAAKYAAGPEHSKIRLQASTRPGSLVLTVRDHGPGVPQDQAKAIFAPFERGGRDVSDPVPGVGLGLALSRGLAREMGGDLTLESPTGGGALFRLELPAQAPGPASERGPAGASGESSTRC